MDSTAALILFDQYSVIVTTSYRGAYRKEAKNNPLSLARQYHTLFNKIILPKYEKLLSQFKIGF